MALLLPVSFLLGQLLTLVPTVSSAQCSTSEKRWWGQPLPPPEAMVSGLKDAWPGAPGAPVDVWGQRGPWNVDSTLQQVEGDLLAAIPLICGPATAPWSS